MTNRTSFADHPLTISELMARPGVIERFVSKIDSSNPRGCWDWKAGTGAGGYGVFKMARGITRQAHRIACTVKHGEGGNLVARHSCNRPLCCNPAHLRWGTNQDNRDDRKRAEIERLIRENKKAPPLARVTRPTKAGVSCNG